MLKKLLLALVIVAVIAGALVGTKLEQFRSMMEAGASMVPPPETVTAAAVRAERWGESLSAIGTLTSVHGVTVAAEVPGKVVRIDFESGQLVEAGTVLVQLDTTIEVAQLRAAEAAAALARTNLERTRNLRANRTASQADLDTTDAQFKEAAAQVEAIRASIAKKSIRAPFSGRLGLRQVNLGQILREGEAVVTLQTLDPIYAEFALPQQDLPRLGVGTPVRLTTDAAPGDTFEGTVNAVSPEIDAATRNVKVQATVPNAREALRAGMFVRVEVVLPTEREVLVVPVTAVLHAPYGDSVFVVEPASGAGANGLVIQQRFVRLGAARGDLVAVTEGLAAGDQVVTNGVFKLRSGMSVVIDNTLAPPVEIKPTPGAG